MNIYRIIVYLTVFIQLINADQSLQCGEWNAYKDEKCFKVFDKKELKSYSDAKNTCYQNEGSSLVSIRSQEEQDYVYNLLHNVHQILNDVWIGGQYTQKVFKWTDNTIVNFTNWPNNYPKNDSKYECIQMSMDAAFNGKWLNEPCDKLNAIVCQKEQNWLFSYLQKTVMELRQSYENITIELQNTKTELMKTNFDLQNSKSELQSTKTELQSIKNDFEYNKIRLENTEKSLIEKITEASPSGTIAYFSNTKPPKGWLKANGQSVSRITYANLFLVIGTTYGSGDGNTTFTLPDLRGEFIRGWSDGRSVDTNRTFGSFQWGSSIPMAGFIDKELHPYSSAYHDRWLFAGKIFDNGFENHVPSGETRDGITFPNDNVQNLIGYSDQKKEGFVTNWNILKGTRPRNIALLACIKY